MFCNTTTLTVVDENAPAGHACQHALKAPSHLTCGTLAALLRSETASLFCYFLRFFYDSDIAQYVKV